MSAHEAAEALRELGLSNYESKVFVALQQLGTGDAQEISHVSDVPRSQVYGAADDLAARGLVEVVESSPKVYRPVALETARAQLRARLDRQQTCAFDNLESLREQGADRADEGSVATLRGRLPIVDRMVDLTSDAETLLVLVGVDSTFLTDDLAAAVRDCARAGVSVVLVTDDATMRERFADTPVQVVLSDPSNEAGAAGRALVVDDATALLSVQTDADPSDRPSEVALWTAETSIGRILVRFVHAGMQFVLDEPYPLPDE